MQEATPSETDKIENIRPVVRTANPSNLRVLIFLAILLLGGLLLFQALEARRMAVTAPSTTFAASGRTDVITSPPPLVLPSQFARVEPSPMPSALPSAQPILAAPEVVERVVTRVVDIPRPSAGPQVAPGHVLPEPLPPQPLVVYEAPSAPDPPRARQEGGEDRVLATRLENPSLTVPKGTIIPAVLESALDSTRAGAVRAIVSRDVMGFDGSRVLIPRGSRLDGEYGADLTYGQNRALIRWTRLLRPDAVIVSVDSPAADPLGRAGVEGKVNSHFFARFGSAILQSVLDIGVGVATRSVTNDAVILALPPGARERVADPGSEVRPTLTVRQGTSVSVFVARDLDFSSVEN